MKKISTQNDTLSENLRRRVLEHSPLLRSALGLADKRRAERAEVLSRPYVEMERPLDACDEPKDPQCSGPGYAHKPHGECSGYVYDRT